MALTLDDSTVRTQIHADLLTAWTPANIYDDTPYLPGTKAELPRAFVELVDAKPQRGQGAASLREVTVVLGFTITGQFAWPSSGTIEAAKLAKAQALLNVLTASFSYAGWNKRDVTDIRFDTGNINNLERYFEIAIDFSVETVTNA